MFFIRELNEEVQYLSEDDGKGGKNLYIEGPACVSNTKNKNGRIYPDHILENEVNRYIKEQLSNDQAVGELGHPSTPNMNLDRISHKFTSIRKDGNNYIAKAKILETPCGKIAKSLITEGVKIGYSSRGLGSLKANKEGIQEVQSDFKLATIADLVSAPSAPGCFVQGIMENASWYYDVTKGTWMEKQFEPLIENMKHMSTAELNAKKFKIFEHFLDQISKK